MSDTTAKTIARWILVLPAAVLGSIAPLVFLALAETTRAYPPTVLGELFFHGLSGFVFIVAGAWMAPVHERTVALVLVILLSLLSGFAAVGLMAQQQTLSLVQLLASVAGGGIGFFLGADHRAVQG